VRLARPWYARALGGHIFQPFIAFALLLELGLFAGLALAGVDVTSARNPAGIAGTLVWLAVWLVGATGWARMDEHGVSWRFWSPSRTVTWDQVQAVVLRNRLVARGGRATIELRLADRQLRIRAANDCGPGRIAFAQALVDEARNRGIQVEVDPDDPRWRAVR